MKTIIAHDYMQFADGGSRLCLSLGRSLSADLCYGFRVADHPYFQVPYTGKEISLSSNYRLPLLKQFVLARAFLNAGNIISQYDQVLFSGFYAPLAVLNAQGRQKTDAKMVYYCHTPPRFLYDQCCFYNSQVPALLRPVWKNFIKWYRRHYEDALQSLPLIVTNSVNVQNRIEKYLNRSSAIVHPPCATHTFMKGKSQGYYLSTGRLDPLKSIDKIIEAFATMPDKELVVMSSGPEKETLKKLAEGYSNITFTGTVSEEKYRQLLSSCTATIYLPRDEDFGMTPVESMAAGKPVIGVAEGGVLETVLDGETGTLLPPDFTIDELCDSVCGLTEERAGNMENACTARAEEFSEQRFVQQMQDLLSSS